MKSIAVIAPDWFDEKTVGFARFDHTAAYFRWTAENIADNLIANFPYDVFFIDSEAATTENIKKFASIADIVIYCNHGSDNALYTNNYEVAICTHNAHILSHKTTYAIACDAGSMLGRTVGTFPQSSFIGYDDVLFIEYGTNPLQWWIERIYRDIWTAAALSLAENQSAEKTTELLKKKYDEAIKLFITKGLDFTFLKHNKDHITTYDNTYNSYIYDFFSATTQNITQTTPITPTTTETTETPIAAATLDHEVEEADEKKRMGNTIIASIVFGTALAYLLHKFLP